MTDDNSNPLLGSFSAMEQSMGQDAYQTNVKAGEAQVRVINAQADMQVYLIERLREKEARKAQLHAGKVFLINITYIACIPVYLVLLSWLFKTLVL